MRPSILIASVLVIAAAACAERALGPADVSGVYGLFRYDNDTLPRTYAAAGGCSARVEDGSLVLDADGTFELHIVRDQLCEDTLSWVNLDAAGTYGGGVGPWLALHDTGTGITYLAWVEGTHVVVKVPQVPSVGVGSVEVEFSAQAARNPTVAVPGGGCCALPPLPPPDTTTIRP
jgi:hypothetical protein